MLPQPDFTGDPIPAYLASLAGPAPLTGPLADDLDTDIAIVGAGFAGLSAALHLAEAGIRATLIDARAIGWGASGRAFGQMAPATKLSLQELEGLLGTERAARLDAAAAQGPSLVFDLVHRYHMAAAPTTSGTLVAAHAPRKVAALRRSGQALQKRGFPVHILEGPEAQALIGSEAYELAILDERGGSVNPLGFAWGLARAAIEHGVVIHTDTPIHALRRNSTRWLLETRQGPIVRARMVIVTANAFAGRLLPELRRTIIPMRAWQAVSAPLPARLAASILPSRQTLNDTQRMPSGIRVHADGCLQVGVDGPLFSRDGAVHLAKLNKRLARLFPSIAPHLQWRETWGGWADMTADNVPHLHKLAPDLFVGVGFGGRGVAMATSMGRDLALLAQAVPETALGYPLSEPKALWYHAIARPLVTALAMRYRIEDQWDAWRFDRRRGSMSHA
ncbi:DAO domain-containing protein [Hyphomicrobiales bacterium]|nr:DAO domain-containing protein [Hyphomicrobiales bacterium]CAH1693685.1 DAO domain-containing protein [Hyphomicrobiales bacterium]